MADDLKIKIKIDPQTGEIIGLNKAFSNLNDEIKKGNKATGQYQNKIKQMGHLAIAGGGSFLVLQGAISRTTGAISTLNKTAGEFERFKSILTTIEGSGTKAGQSFEWVKEFGAKTPYDITQVLDSFTKLKAYGIEPTDGTLRTLGDTASAMGKDLNQAVEAMADAVVGENERLKEFGIRASKQGDLIRYSWVNASGQTQEKVVQNNSKIIQSTLSAIFNEKYAGAMDKMSTTWGGLTSNLQDNWTNFKHSLAIESGIFDQSKEAVRLLNNELHSLTKGDIQNIGDVLKSGFSAGISGAYGLAVGLNGAYDAFKTLQFGIVQFGSSINIIFKDTYQNILYLKMGSLEAYNAVVKLTNKVGVTNVALADTLSTQRKIVELEADKAKIEATMTKDYIALNDSYETRQKILEKIKGVVEKIQAIETKPKTNNIIDVTPSNVGGHTGPAPTKADTPTITPSFNADEAIAQYERYYEAIGDLSAGWQLAEARLYKENTHLQQEELERLIKLKKAKYFEDQKNRENALRKKLTGTLDNSIQEALNGKFDFRSLTRPFEAEITSAMARSLTAGISNADLSGLTSFLGGAGIFAGAVGLLGGLFGGSSRPKGKTGEELLVEEMERLRETIENQNSILSRDKLKTEKSVVDNLTGKRTDAQDEINRLKGLDEEQKYDLDISDDDVQSMIDQLQNKIKNINAQIDKIDPTIKRSEAKYREEDDAKKAKDNADRAKRRQQLDFEYYKRVGDLTGAWKVKRELLKEQYKEYSTAQAKRLIGLDKAQFFKSTNDKIKRERQRELDIIRNHNNRLRDTYLNATKTLNSAIIGLRLNKDLTTLSSQKQQSLAFRLFEQNFAKIQNQIKAGQSIDSSTLSNLTGYATRGLESAKGKLDQSDYAFQFAQTINKLTGLRDQVKANTPKEILKEEAKKTNSLLEAVRVGDDTYRVQQSFKEEYNRIARETYQNDIKAKMEAQQEQDRVNAEETRTRQQEQHAQRQEQNQNMLTAMQQMSARIASLEATVAQQGAERNSILRQIESNGTKAIIYRTQEPDNPFGGFNVDD